ncbi:MAG: ArnT family glycosyltransferase [Patescibacteria group bacterium]
MLSTKKIKAILFCVFVLSFFGSHIPYLGRDVINPDAVNWHNRSEQFVVALKGRNFENTYQHYHPGVTQMWLTGSVVEAVKQLNGFSTYDKDNYLLLHTVAKYANVVVQFALTLTLFFVLKALFSKTNSKYTFEKAILIVTLLSIEPFFLGNARLIHLDIFLTLFVFIGLSFSYLAMLEKKLLFTFLSGAFLSAAFLSKSIAIGALPFVLIVFGYLTYIKQGKGYLLKSLVLFLGTYMATAFLFFPALWVSPAKVLIDIFSEGERIGVRNGHTQIVMGESSEDPGIFFYPLILLMKTSPFVLFGVLTFIFTALKNVKKIHRPLTQYLNSTYGYLFYLGIFYLGYFSVMTFPTKKLDRYMLPVFPYLVLCSVLGYFLFSSIYRHVVAKLLIVLLLLVFILCPLFRLYPWYFTYTSPLFGSAQNANSIVAQKPFGVGIPDLKEYIFNTYNEEYPNIGFIDTKPMRAIYKNSSIYDIRVSGTSDYDILVLAINEEMPEKVIESDNNFIYDRSLFINGLEFWKIYVKETSRFYKN